MIKNNRLILKGGCLLLLGMAATFFSVRGTRASSKSPTVHSFCPLQTPEEWQQFLERVTSKNNWVETCEDSVCDAQFYKFVKQNVADTLSACSEFIDQHDAIYQCVDHLRKFTPAWLEQHSPDSYGFTVDNRTYLSRQDQSDKPENMMKIPDALIAALPDRARVEAAARTEGWRYLTHDSALGGFRTFVMIPDPQGRFDQWMLLNLRDSKNHISEDTPLSLLTVQRKTRAGKTLSRVRLHFRDYNIVRLNSKRTALTLNEDNNGKCYSCHSGGVRQLIARVTPMLEAKPIKGEQGYDPNHRTPSSPQFAFARLMEFNRRLRSYGQPDWQNDVLPENHGPILGRTLGCTDCHDGRSRGFLSVLSSPDQVGQKVVAEMAMPPDTNLVRTLERSEMNNPSLPPEDAALFDRARHIHEGLLTEFNRSRYPELHAWFLEKRCRP